tara:strand:- start:394 stop:927 length:534 start_codon:yes stop_codon:yes gene_type:complete
MSAAVKRKEVEGAPATWVAIDKLIPWAANPRENEKAVERVAASISRFGWGAVVIARKENGEIIAGHTRVRAAKSLGLKKVPVRYLDISEGEAHALALADNRIGEIADWSENLSDVLRDLGDVDLDGLGFEDSELEALLQPSDYDDVAWQTFDSDIGADEKDKGRSVTCPSCSHGFKV